MRYKVEYWKATENALHRKISYTERMSAKIKKTKNKKLDVSNEEKAEKENILYNSYKEG